jgi:hypothetical protein
MREFIVATVQALQSGQYDAPGLTRALDQLSQSLESVENRYQSAPEEEEDLRRALLQSLRLYQLSLDLLRDCLVTPDPERLERALSSAREAELQLDEIEEWSTSEDF